MKEFYQNSNKQILLEQSSASRFSKCSASMSSTIREPICQNNLKAENTCKTQPNITGEYRQFSILLVEN